MTTRLGQPKTVKTPKIGTPLSVRELEIMKYAAMGYTREQTAKALFIEVNTVQTHRYRALIRLDATNVAQGIAIINSWFLAEARWWAKEMKRGSINWTTPFPWDPPKIRIYVV